MIEFKYLFHCEDTLFREKFVEITCFLVPVVSHLKWTTILPYLLLNFFSSTVPAWVHQAIKPVVRALEQFIPQPYATEIRGLAALYGSDISDIILLNFAYEVSAYVNLLLMQFVYSITMVCLSIYTWDGNVKLWIGQGCICRISVLLFVVGAKLLVTLLYRLHWL